MRRHERPQRKAAKDKNLIGVVKRHPDGFGFFIPDDPDHPDVYIPRKEMSGVMTNDRIEILSYAEKGGVRYRGDVLSVVTRANTRVMGKFERVTEDRGIVRDRSGAWGSDLVVDS